MSSYEKFESKSIRVLQQNAKTHGESLYVLSSFGVDSGLTIHLANKAGIKPKVLGVNTGFQPPETEIHRKTLEQREKFTSTIVGPTDEEIEEITASRLWETDLKQYNYRTKIRPLSLAIRSLGIKRLVTGVRANQTANRAALGDYSVGSDGEIRMNIVRSWPQSAVDEYFEAEDLPRHPLYYEGYDSVGDWTITKPGRGRSGRNLGPSSECGINVPQLAVPDQRFVVPRGVL